MAAVATVAVEKAVTAFSDALSMAAGPVASVASDAMTFGAESLVVSQNALALLSSVAVGLQAAFVVAVVFPPLPTPFHAVEDAAESLAVALTHPVASVASLYLRIPAASAAAVQSPTAVAAVAALLAVVAAADEGALAEAEPVADGAPAVQLSAPLVRIVGSAAVPAA